MPNNYGISAYYYPTLAILVDDSERFLTTISFELDSRLAYISFTDPAQALKFIKKNNQKNYLLNKCLSENVDADNFGLKSAEHDVKVNLLALYNQIFNAERFNEPTVVVVDYSMPGMNGDEFCRKLRAISDSIKIILLTGEADAHKGIELFNAGLIDRFISKESLNFGEITNSAILELQKDYFEAQSEVLIKNLSTKSITCLKDEAFIKIFHEICRKYGIVEYYLIESTGSFLLLKFDGTPLWLIVISDIELNDYYEVAKDHGAPQTALQSLKTGEKIPYFKNADEYMNAKGLQWGLYLHPAEKITGKETGYYYALLKDLETLNVKDEKVLSYKNYLENVWPPV